jgi:KDO2-lipid IV(A) lauroyltransferase
MSAKALKNWAIYRFVWSLKTLAGRLPRRTTLSLFGRLGLLAHGLLRTARRRTITNLSRAFGWEEDDPRLRRTVREVFVQAGKNVADLIWLPRLTASNIDELVRIENGHHLHEAIALGRGVIVVTGHIGNWELMAASYALRGYSVSAVARRVYDPRLDRMLNDLRKNARVRGISRDSGLREMIRVLRRGELLGVLMDQDTKVRGVFVPFFGRLAHTPVGPVMLAMKTRAPIVPIAIHRQPDDTHVSTVMPPVTLRYTDDREADLRINTWRCTRVLEEFIRQHPAQWVWMHNRWKKRPTEADRDAWKEKIDVP